MSCVSVLMVGFEAVTAVVLLTGAFPVTRQVGQLTVVGAVTVMGLVPAIAADEMHAPAPPPITILLAVSAALDASLVVLVKQGIPPELTVPDTVSGNADPPPAPASVQ